jgi:hypothetical protein
LKVQLRYATLPGPLGLFAAHYWFVVFDGESCHRWEVWQTKNAGGRSIGHVHCDLKPADAGVGGGPARVAAEWTGPQAVAIQSVLEKAETYPHCGRYLVWPGPNSNTFVAWVLRRARVEHKLGPMALGKRYPVA